MRSFIEPGVGGHHTQPNGIARATKGLLLLRFLDERTFGWLNNRREAGHHYATTRRVREAICNASGGADALLNLFRSIVP